MIYLYCRVSSNKQIEGLSLSLQGDKKLLAEIAKKYGAQISSKIYEDEGVSAFSGANETKGALKELLSDIESGLIKPNDMIVMRHLDRLSRQSLSKSMKIFSGILDHGVDIYTTLEGRLYSNKDSETESISMILASLSFKLAHEESLKKQYLTNKSALKRVEQFQKEEFHISGAPFSIGIGGTPFHCRVVDKSIQENPKKLKIAQELVSYVMAGNGYHKSQKWLKNTHKITMSIPGIKNLLKSKALYGHLSLKIKDIDAIARVRNEKNEKDDIYNSEIISEDNYFPAVISEAQWYQLQSKLDEKSSKGNKTHSTLLSGRQILQCGECQSSMTILYSANKGSSGKPVYYSCIKCNNAEKIYTTNAIVLNSLAIHDLKYDDQTVIEEEMNSVKAEIDYKGKQYDEISQTYADDPLNKRNRVLKAKMSSLSNEINELEEKYQKLRSKSFKNNSKKDLDFFINEKTKIIDEVMVDDSITNEKYGSLIARVIEKIIINKDGLIEISTESSKKYYYLPTQNKNTGRRMGYPLIIIPDDDQLTLQIRKDKDIYNTVFTEKEISKDKYQTHIDNIHPSLLRCYSEPHTEKQAFDKFIDALKAASIFEPLIISKRDVMSRTDITDKQWNTHKERAIEYMKSHKLFNINKKNGNYIIQSVALA